MKFKFGLAVLGCLLTTAAFAQTRIISHVTRADGGFTTTVILENNSASAQTVRLLPRDAAGTDLGAVSVEMQPGTVQRSASNALFDGADVGYFSIEAADEVTVGVDYAFDGTGGSPAYASASSDVASSWRFYPGDWNQIFDGIAFVNTGDVATNVWLAQKDANGNVITARQIATDLAAGAKGLYVVGSSGGSEFTLSEDSYFELSANQALAITALRGTLGDAPLNLLWTNQARAMSRATTKRDEVGVWHIEDGSMYDVFEMMGYNVAVDRLAQLSIFVRQSQGTLAEIFGADAVNADILTRTFNYSQAELEAGWANLDAENRTIIQAYVNGVNRRIGQVNATAAQAEAEEGSVESLLPLEHWFTAQSRATPITPYDVMQIMSNIQTGFSIRNFGMEQIENGALLQHLQTTYGVEQGNAMFDDLRPTVDPTAQTMMSPAATKNYPLYGPADMAVKSLNGLQRATNDLRQLITEHAEFLKSKGAYLKMGSYAWAVSGALTESGNPVLLSGPQMGFAAPSLATEGSIKSDYITVSGMTVAGVPAIFVGRTPNHAWGFQVGHASAWDYYVEDDADVSLVREEEIQVRLGEPVAFQGYASNRGPAVTQVDGKWLSWKYSHRGYEWDLANGIIAMARAENLEDFNASVNNLGLTQHLTYVDKAGNIAYWLTGRTPVRESGDWRVPQGMFADMPVLEWDAAVIQDIPHEVNPPQGYFAGWNNKAGPNWVDWAATAGFGPYHRGEVIEDYFQSLGEGEKFSFEDLRDFVIRLGVNARFYGGNPLPVIKDQVLEALRNNPTDERNMALDLLENWDGALVEGGAAQWINGRNYADGALLTETLIPKLISKTFDDELGTESPDNMVGPLYRYQTFVHSLGQTGVSKTYDWFSNLSDSTAPQTSEAIILAAIDESLAELGAAPWGVGARGNMAHIHPLFGDLIAVLNAPPISMGLTPTPAGNRATYTQVVEYDADGTARIEVLSTLGQSGEILGTLNGFMINPHYLDQKTDFDAFQFRAFELFQ